MTVQRDDYVLDVAVVDLHGAEQVPSPRYPAKAAGISSDDLPQGANSVVDDSAEESWPEPEEEDHEPEEQR